MCARGPLSSCICSPVLCLPELFCTAFLSARALLPVSSWIHWLAEQLDLANLGDLLIQLLPNIVKALRVGGTTLGWPRASPQTQKQKKPQNSEDKDRCGFTGKKVREVREPHHCHWSCTQPSPNWHFIDMELSHYLFNQPIPLVPAEQRLLQQPHTISSWPIKSLVLRTRILLTTLQSLGHQLPPPSVWCHKLTGASLLWGLTHPEELPSLRVYLGKEGGWTLSSARSRSTPPAALPLFGAKKGKKGQLKLYLGASLGPTKCFDYKLSIFLSWLFVSSWFLLDFSPLSCFPHCFIHWALTSYKMSLLLFTPAPTEKFHFVTPQQSRSYFEQKMWKWKRLHLKSTWNFCLENQRDCANARIGRKSKLGLNPLSRQAQK